MTENALIDRIYEAAAFPEMWPAVLLDLATEVDGAGAILITRRSDSWVGWRMSPTLEQTVERYLRSDAASRSLTTARLLSANRAGFVADHKIFSHDEFMIDPLMSEFGTPNGLHHAAATVIQTPNQDFAIVQIQRRVGLPPFTNSELQRLDSYRPHLARSAMLAARWRLAKLHAAAEALELIGLPAAILDPTGRVMFANRLIETVSPKVVWLPKERLAFADPAATRLLRQAVAHLADEVVKVPMSFPVRGAEGSKSAVAHVLPIRGRVRDIFDQAAGLLVVTALGGAVPRDPVLIQGLYDLTASEARIATGILEGLTVKAIALRHGVGRETVRSQMKAVFAKTGCHRQSEFVAKLQPLLRIGWK